MSGLQPLERQWTILRTLSARRFGATVRELAEEHDVSQKTIRRDLVLLRDLGFPVSPRDGAHGRNHWVATWDKSAPLLTFDVSEVLALYLGRTLMDPLAGTVFWDSAHSAFRKIRAMLDERVLEYLAKLAGLIHRTSFRDSDYHDKSQLIDDLMVAAEDHCVTHITYQSARSTEPLSYPVHPYGLVYHRGSLYLIANSEQHDEIRTFKLDRISEIALDNFPFTKPEDFNLQDYLRNSLGIYHGDGRPQRVTIRFAPEVAGYVAEHRWHASQKLTRQNDGSLLAEFKLASFEEAVAWALSFGAKAEVLEPEELCEEIRRDVARMAATYGALVEEES